MLTRKLEGSKAAISLLTTLNQMGSLRPSTFACLRSILASDPLILIPAAVKISQRDCGRLPEAMVELIKSSTNLKWLAKLERGIPAQTTNLQVFALELSLHIKGLLDQGHGQKIAISKRARIFNNIAVRFMDFDKLELAQSSAKEAVREASAAAEAAPGELPLKASTLNNYAESLARAGHIVDALENAEEAAAVYKGLLRTEAGDYWHNLALTLKHLSDLHSRFDDKELKELALKEAKQSIELFRGLAGASEMEIKELVSRVSNQDAVFLKASARQNMVAFGLAVARNSEASCLLELGRSGAALEAAIEAQEISTKLRLSDKNQFAAESAAITANLANCLVANQQWERALEKAHEASSIYAALERTRPGRFASDRNRVRNLATAIERELAAQAARQTSCLMQETPPSQDLPRRFPTSR